MEIQNKFDKDFIWGTATASFQIEGAFNIDGKSDSIWDTYCRIPGKILNNDNGEIACDHYNRIEEDVALMASMNIKHYRFSISWARIYPTEDQQINQKGIDFYNKLIDLLIKHDITPYITIYHWDHPQWIEEKYNGWLGGENMIDLYTIYSKALFENFGDRVKYWITFNEPFCSCMLGYNNIFAPGINDPTSKKTLQAAHCILLSHSTVYNLYKKYFKDQKGKIGITLNSAYSFAKKDSDPVKYQKNVEAAERNILFNLAWFSDCIYFGNYPEIMREKLNDILPKFSNEEQILLKGSTDFFGINHYFSDIAEDNTKSSIKVDDWNHVINNRFYDEVSTTNVVNPEHEVNSMGWEINPLGFKKLLHWIQKRYNPDSIFVTENGACFIENTEKDAINDTKREEYFKEYILAMKDAIDEGVNVKAYFLWSFLDNFEWCQGYSQRFGIVRVDFKTQKRTIKNSGKWYSKFIS